MEKSIGQGTVLGTVAKRERVDPAGVGGKVNLL
jgi:hypothetical protein